MNVNINIHGDTMKFIKRIQHTLNVITAICMFTLGLIYIWYVYQITHTQYIIMYTFNGW